MLENRFVEKNRILYVILVFLRNGVLKRNIALIEVLL